MDNVEFVIYGEPMGKQRPRVYSIKGHAHAYTPRETILYENKVANAYKGVANDYVFDRNDLISVEITLHFSLNKCDYGKNGLNKSGRTKLERVYCDKKPDLDNAIKSILDGLNGVAYYDDKQVVRINAFKLWTESSPKVFVKLSKLN